jgi:hypothetical protein
VTRRAGEAGRHDALRVQLFMNGGAPARSALPPAQVHHRLAPLFAR